MIEKSNKSFCVLPWVNLSTDPDGNVKPCCVSTGFIKKPNGEIYNLGNDSIDEIYDSKDFVELRQKMLKGELVPECEQCYTMEKNGGISSRHIHNSIWFNNQEVKNKFFKINNLKTIEYLDLRFGNLCNLSCKSCQPKNSSQLEKELLELNPSIKKFINVETYPNINKWYKTKTFKKNVTEQYSNLRRLYITGGEPSINQSNIELLETLTQLNLSKNIDLTISSNFTNTNYKFFENLKNFKNVLLFASIDGYGSMQEYLRYPSNWEQVDKNFQKILSYVNIDPTPVIQTGNLNNIVELFEYFENFNRSVNKSIVKIQPIILENPEHLNFLYLPIDYKINCWKKIEYWIKHECRYQPVIFHRRMAAVKKKCFTETSTDNLKKFFEFNDLFDNQRNYFLKDVNPELNQLRGYPITKVNGVPPSL